MKALIAKIVSLSTERHSLHARILTGAAWSLFGSACGSALMMVSSVAVARILGAKSFGQFAVVLSTINLFTSLFAASLGMTATKYVAEFRACDPKRAGKIIGLTVTTALLFGGISSLAFLIFPTRISNTLVGNGTVSQILAVGSFAIFFAALTSAQVGVLMGFEAFGSIAGGNLVRGCMLLILMTGGAIGWGVTGGIAGYGIASAGSSIVYSRAIRSACATCGIRVSLKPTARDVQIFRRFTVPVVASTFCFTPAVWWSNLMLVNRSGFAEAGIFNAILNWQTFVLFFTNAVSNVGLPTLSNLRAENDYPTFRKCLVVNVLLTSLPAIVVAAPVALASGFIMRFYGPTFAHGAPALALISMAAVLAAMNAAVGPALWSIEASGSAVFLSLLRGAILVLGASFLAPFGATGLAGAYVIMGFVQTASNFPVAAWMVKRNFRVAARVEGVAA